MTSEWKIEARNPALQREGLVKDYEKATFTPVFNDIGTWSITMDRRAPQAANLTQPGWGVVVSRDGQVVFSGPMNSRRHVRELDKNTIELSGYSDDAILRRRLVSPSPGEGVPPYTAQASDIRTGLASTVLRAYVSVNASTAAISSRQVPGLTIGPNLAVGTTVTGNGRWDTDVLQFIQPLAIAGGVGFRVVQVGAVLEFQVYAPTDRTASVKFAVGLKNLAGYEYESIAPEANYVYVGASGTGTSRVISEYSDADSIAAWGRIEGEFVDNRGTSDPTQLQQTGTEALTQNGEQASLSITPIETTNLRYGEHYFLGDRVTVQLDDDTSTPYDGVGQVQDILRSVVIQLDLDKQTVTPAVGTAARTDIAKVFTRMKNLARRLNNIERWP
jgi:hypothetical protein